LRASPVSKPVSEEKIPGDLIPVPTTLGVFILLITILAFAAGRIRNEIALILIGGIFQALLSYCFFTIFILSWIHRNLPGSLEVKILNQPSPGTPGEYLFINKKKEKKIFRMPGILIRYVLQLSTKDGQRLWHLFDPDFPDPAFPTKKRGAYYTKYDEFWIFDAPGFFKLTLGIPYKPIPRLLVTPKILDSALGITIRSSGEGPGQEQPLPQNDSPLDQRPYIPGDDPRRINWKLYGHLGDLFIKKGEPEPPPHTKRLIAVDSYADPALFTPERARENVDLLCEQALALAAIWINQGIDVGIGSCESKSITRGSLFELAGALAYPSAHALGTEDELPRPAPQEALVILALPRLSPGSSALVRLGQNSAQEMNALFLYSDSALTGPAQACAEAHKSPNLHAQSINLTAYPDFKKRV
jgi:hypothetical protein